MAPTAGPTGASVELPPMVRDATLVPPHRLAKRIGAWPSVLASAAASGAASWVLADRGD